MLIDRAIRNLTDGREDCGMIPFEEYTLTIDLAIEALKQVKESRLDPSTWAPKTLPGETIAVIRRGGPTCR